MEAVSENFRYAALDEFAAKLCVDIFAEVAQHEISFENLLSYLKIALSRSFVVRLTGFFMRSMQVYFYFGSYELYLIKSLQVLDLYIF